MEYLKKNGTDYKEDFLQVFRNKPRTDVLNTEFLSKRQQKIINDAEMAIAKFIATVHVATYEEISKYINTLYPGKSETTVLLMLNSLIKDRILNSFILCDAVSVSKVPEDAEVFYCMDVGASILIQHFSDVEIGDWNVTDTYMEPVKVKKLVQAARFLANLYESKNLQTNPFNVCTVKPVYRLRRSTVSPTFDIYTTAKDGTPRFYVCDVVCKEQFPLSFASHINKMTSIFGTNAWKARYGVVDKPPCMIYILESEDMLNDLRLMLEDNYVFTPDTGYRVTTFERLEKGFVDKNAFLMYEPASKEFIECQIASLC